jgi:chitin disaccharide deacetylase
LQILARAAKLIDLNGNQAMKRLIVNADDFGLAESVNRGIVMAHREGILTSASLLANGLAFDEAIALSRQLPHLSLGVHLNISAGTPVSSAARIPTLLNERGQLHLSPLRVGLSLLTHQVSLEDIRSEFRAQALKVLDAGVTPAHLDSHLHVHLLPQLAPIVIDLAREFRIRHVRCPAENLEATLPLLWKFAKPGIAALERSTVAFTVKSLGARFREQLRKGGLVCPDAFYGLVHTGFLDAKTLTALLHLVPEGTTELMCHPGFPSPELESVGGKLTHSRETEVLALTAREIKEALGPLGIRLTNFRDLEKNLSV